MSENKVPGFATYFVLSKHVTSYGEIPFVFLSCATYKPCRNFRNRHCLWDPAEGVTRSSADLKHCRKPRVPCTGTPPYPEFLPLMIILSFRSVVRQSQVCGTKGFNCGSFIPVLHPRFILSRGATVSLGEAYLTSSVQRIRPGRGVVCCDSCEFPAPYSGLTNT